MFEVNLGDLFIKARKKVIDAFNKELSDGKNKEEMVGLLETIFNVQQATFELEMQKRAGGNPNLVDNKIIQESIKAATVEVKKFIAGSSKLFSGDKKAFTVVIEGINKSVDTVRDYVVAVMEESSDVMHKDKKWN